jgi:hypothetical protein
LRVDNGTPWGSKGDLPTDLALWLMGLDIAVWWNPPARPQENGVVERGQGVGKNWTEPQAARSVRDLQQRFEQMDRVQREEYPYEGERSRLAVYPHLAHSGRVYSARWEQQHWDLALVQRQLSESAVPRRVDSKGLISIYNRNHYVGKRHQGHVVYVQLDPEANEWLVSDARGQQLRTRPAPEISRQRIRGLTVGNRR